MLLQLLGKDGEDAFTLRLFLCVSARNLGERGGGEETADTPQALILSTPGVLLPHSLLFTQASSSSHLLLPGHSTGRFAHVANNRINQDCLVWLQVQRLWALLDLALKPLETSEYLNYFHLSLSLLSPWSL